VNAYETVIIIDPATDDAGIEREIVKISGIITAHAGQIVNATRWGKRKMTYRINNRQEGYYVCIQFNAPPAAPKELDRMLRLDESVIRHLIICGHIQDATPVPAPVTAPALAPETPAAATVEKAVQKEATAV
jgi:small subunit ribosomal protein S6